MTHEKLTKDQLGICTDGSQVGFSSSEEVSPAGPCTGQQRAVTAIATALKISGPGYHVLAIGKKGTGKMNCIYSVARDHADSMHVESTPDRVLLPIQGRESMYQEVQFTDRRGEVFINMSEQAVFAAFSQNAELYSGVAQDMRAGFSQYSSLEDYLRWLDDYCLMLMAGENTDYEYRQLHQILPVLLHTGHEEGMPVVREPFPDAASLLGSYSVDTEIGRKHVLAGSLIQASNGILIIDARQFVENVANWRLFREILNNGLIPLNSILSTQAQQSSSLPMNGFAELTCRVILVCDLDVYYQLQAIDAHLDHLFPIVAEFENSMPRNLDNIATSIKIFTALAEQYQCLPLNRDAMALLTDISSRLAGSQRRLSLSRTSLSRCLREANQVAVMEGSSGIKATHIRQAMADQEQRVVADKMDSIESVLHGETRVELSGRVAGQINSLTMVTTAMQSYLEPSRITATVRAGDGSVVDIEREVNLGGSIHSKGVLILASLLSGRYSRHLPLSLVASLVFEQSYSEIDGDSASAAEMMTLLSAITEVPLKQNLAITGSIDQRGQILCVGDINEKIEGFYRLCEHHGNLDGMGVVIPVPWH